MCIVLVAVACGACGRLEFSAHSATDGNDQLLDAPIDAASAPLTACLQPLGTVASALQAHSQSIAIAPPIAILGFSDGPQGIQVIDISNPNAPTLRGTLLTSTGPAALAATDNDVLSVKIRGNYAYLATYTGGLVVVDISNPNAPTFVSGLDLPSETWGITLVGSYVLAANYELGVVVIDVSNPAAPRLVGSVASPLGMPHAISVNGNRAYVAYPEGVEVFDISTIQAPTHINSVATPGTNLYEVWSPDNKYAFAVDKLGHGLLAIDLQVTPARVVYTSPAEATAQYRSVTGDGTSMFVAVQDLVAGAVLGFDTTLAAQPRQLGPYASTGRVYQVAVAGDLVAGAIFNTGALQLWRRQSVCP